MSQKEAAVTLEDLRTGKRARISEQECEQLTGRRRASLQRDRWKRKGMPFQKDENGRVWYTADDVLSYLDSKKHQSTSEYDTHSHVLRLEKAREQKKANRSHC